MLPDMGTGERRNAGESHRKSDIQTGPIGDRVEVHDSDAQGVESKPADDCLEVPEVDTTAVNTHDQLDLSFGHHLDELPRPFTQLRNPLHGVRDGIGLMYVIRVGAQEYRRHYSPLSPASRRGTSCRSSSRKATSALAMVE